MRKIWMLAVLLLGCSVVDVKGQLEEWDTHVSNIHVFVGSELPNLYGLKGDIESIDERTYWAVEKGLEIEQGKLEETRKLKYDKEGRLVREEEVSSISYKARRLNIDYDYVADGSVVEKKIVVDNKTLARFVYKYGGDGKILKIQYHVPEMVNVRMYDSQGMVTKVYPELGCVLRYTRTYEYDDKGNVARVFKKERGEEESKYVFEYDASGEKIKVVKEFYQDDQEDLYMAYAYNQNGHIESVYGNDEYNCAGVAELEYKYDDFGNWIEQVLYYEKEDYSPDTPHGRKYGMWAKYITVREINYRQ